MTATWTKQTNGDHHNSYVQQTATKKVVIRKDNWTSVSWRVDVVFYNDKGEPAGPALFGGTFKTLGAAKSAFAPEGKSLDKTVRPWGEKFIAYIRKNGHASGACIVCGRPTSDNAKWVAASPADGTFHPASDIEALAQTQPELEVSAYQIGANCFAKHRAQLSICEVK